MRRKRQVEKKPSSVDQGRSFEKEVELLLQLKGYKVVRNNLINGTQIDLHATRDDPLDNLSLVVECADRDRPIGIDLVKEKASVLLSLKGTRRHYRLMFVARNDFTAEAKAFAESQSDVVLLTLNELEALVVNLKPYVNWYISNYENSLGIFKDSNLLAHYVDLSAHDASGEPIPSLNEFAREWLADDQKNLLFVLGDYGAGKTSFSRQFVYQLLRAKYVEHTDSRYTPILLNLREYRGKLDLRRVVIDSFTNTYGVELQSFSAFERLCSTGNVILVLDGFDEMNDRSDPSSIMESFNQIYLFASLSAKVLLTCRSNFFRSNADVIELLHRFSISIPLESQSQLIEVHLKDQEQLLYIDRLSARQIEEFVRKRFSDKADQMLSTIRNIHDLSDLSSRPVLLDMILSTLPELERARQRINSASLYKHYTDRWTKRDQWRVTIPLRVRTNFCEMLAWSMHCANANGIPYALLEEIMIGALKAMAETAEQLGQFKNDIQTCSFMVRVAETDEFRFAHKSFVEFFVAKKLVADLSVGASIKTADSSRFPQKSSQERPDREAKYPSAGNNVEDLLDGLLTRDDTLLESGMTFADFPSLGKSSSWDFFARALNERIRSTQLFASMQESEVSELWPFVSSDSSVRSHLENEIRAIFSKQWLPSFSEDIPISEEIATFAIEHILNSGLTFDRLAGQLKEDHSIDVLCDIARLSKGTDWAQQNGEELKRYIRMGQNPHLKIACAALLAREPKLISIEFVREARNSLSPEGWSYLLFELASRAEQFSTILATLSQDDTVGAIDKVICLYGLGGQLPSDENHTRMTNLVVQLLRSPDPREQVLASRICASVEIEERVSMFSQAFKKADTPPLKKSIIRLIEESIDGIDWRILRRLAAQESDANVRNALSHVESRIRNLESDKKNRAGWNRLRGNNAIRETLWRSRKG